MVGVERANAKNKCALCGRATEEVKVTRNINGIDYYFDKEECEVIFRRLESVYGDTFFQQ